MRLKVEVQLSPAGTKNPLRILDRNNQCLVLADDRLVSVEVPLEYNMESSIDLFSIENFTANTAQQVSVTGICINDVPLKNWRRFCVFKTSGNRYVADAVHRECCELSFNGHFMLDVAAGRDQFCWFLYHYSARRLDFVHANTVLDCNSPHHCYSAKCADVHSSSHTNRFINAPYHPQHRPGDSFHYGCFGCSITAGTGLARGEEWPALLAEDSTVLNLGVAAAGADTIFLNLHRALDTFEIERVIVLFPNLQRRLLRFGVEGQHFRMPVTNGNVIIDAQDTCIWFQWAWLNDRISQVRRDLCMDDGTAEYSRRVIGRTVKLLQRKGVPFWVSSWDTETYEVLGSVVSADHLLPFFRKDSDALDGVHSSGQSHRAWLEQIVPIIQS